jgi:hypothetical protein
MLGPVSSPGGQAGARDRLLRRGGHAGLEALRLSRQGDEPVQGDACVGEEPLVAAAWALDDDLDVDREDRDGVDDLVNGPTPLLGV